jgi:hypothetical protein
MPLPYVGTGTIGRPDVTTVGRRLLVEFIRGEKSWSALIGRAHLFDEFIARRAECVATFCHFHQMHVRVKVIEDLKVRGTRVIGRVHSKEIDGKGFLEGRTGLGDAPIQG